MMWHDVISCESTHVMWFDVLCNVWLVCGIMWYLHTFHMMPHDVIWCDVDSCDVIWCVMWCLVCVVSCVMQCALCVCDVWWYVMPCHVVWCGVEWCNVISCYLMPCLVSSHVMSCHVNSCVVMWCDVLCGVCFVWYYHIFAHLSEFMRPLLCNTGPSCGVVAPCRLVYASNHAMMQVQ